MITNTNIHSFKNNIILNMINSFVILLILIGSLVRGQHDPHNWPNRSVIVHLMEWKWLDIADECERFLAPKGYAGVQVSPAAENIILEGRSWDERYQTVSYKIITRSGNENEFLNMTTRCNEVGIRIYVDVILNHMTGDEDIAIGTGGTTGHPHTREYPGVPYNISDFHPRCSIENWNDPYQVRNCELVGLHDLNQTIPYVQDRMVDYLDRLVDLGVAGFRVDAAKHMWPEDLRIIYSRVKNLNINFGFKPNSKPFVYQEIIDYGNEPISKYEYTPMGLVTEFKYSNEISRAFRGDNALKFLKTWGKEWGFAPTDQALVFVCNHDNQRSDKNILNYKSSKQYKMAIAFAMSHPFGVLRIISSFAFDSAETSPPTDSNGNLISPSIQADGSCGNGYICEHRWRQIYNMVGFRLAVQGTEITNWWDNGNKQIAFCRGNKGFILFNGDRYEIRGKFNTCLPTGTYCDIISGSKINGRCSGIEIRVNNDHTAQFFLPASYKDGMIAIHENARLT